jgi:uncharacterized protein YcbX
MITLSSIIYYPIKACRGFEVDSAYIERMGLEHDRRMMVVPSRAGSSHSANIRAWLW